MAGDDIVQDFLVEAGEIIEKLEEQLVALETAPADGELLNAIFRAFHTIKGGAGFLGLDALVSVSHAAEDAFDRLRQGTLGVDSGLMDVMLQTLDVLRAMFDRLRRGEPPGAAPADVLARIASYTQPLADGGAMSAALAGCDTGTTASAAADPDPDLISEEEFDALLDRLHAGAPATATPLAAGAPPDLISDDEFEALLDDLHGVGRFQTPSPPAASVAPPASVPSQPVPTPARSAAERAPDTTVRVETAVLDRIMNMVGELVLIRNRLTNLQSSIGNDVVTQTVANLDIVTNELQMTAMKTRMQPIGKVFGRFPRVVRDLARSLGKEVALEMHGEDTELDKNLVESLSDPLVHLVRNAVDHGIEAPAARRAAGKPASGRLRLAAEQAGDQIILTIADDGRGIDAEALRHKAGETGLLDPEAAARLSPRECYELIFLPGFSTRDEVSDISGRGVGMDVVKTRITQINGSIEIDSVPGQGTTIRIRAPLTLAIMPTLMVILGTQVFALPLANVQEILHFERAKAREIDGRKTMLVRGKALPLFYLSRWLVRGMQEFNAASGHVVIVRVGNQNVALLVDELIGQEEVVIKPLGALLHGTRGLAGATITGNGRIALIIDLPSLLESYAQR